MLTNMSQSFRFKPAEIGKFSAGPDECLKQFGKDCRIIGMTMGARFVRYNEGDFCYVAFEEDGYVCGFKYCIPFDIEKMGRV